MTGSALSQLSQLTQLALVLSLLGQPGCGSNLAVSSFENPVNNHSNSHLVVHESTGDVYLGATNLIYHLSAKLEVRGWSNFGPYEDSPECSGYMMRVCPADSSGKEEEASRGKLTDNYNKVLLIDYRNRKLIHCGSVFQGLCWLMGLDNISNNEVEIVDRPIVANEQKTSTVAFIAPGPPNPKKNNVFNVATSFTGNSPDRRNVPSVSSRSLDPATILDYASGPDTNPNMKKTQMFVRNREEFPVHYIHGFSSQGFSYFISVQKKSLSRAAPFHTKLIRFCQRDKAFDSYTEIPLECKSPVNAPTGHSSSLHKFPLATAGFLGKAGRLLRADMEDSNFDDVLYVTFALASPFGSDVPGRESALCVFSMKYIRRKFQENIQYCFNGNGRRGLEWMNVRRPQACVQDERFDITEDFCGSELNSPLGGSISVVSRAAIAYSSETLTAVTVDTVGDFTVAFLGTKDGQLKKVLLEGMEKGTEYDSLNIQRGQKILPDLVLDQSHSHVYVMTPAKVVKIRTHGRCGRLTTCGDCTDEQDPYCGWCLRRNACATIQTCGLGPQASLDVLADDKSWLSYNHGGQCEAGPVQCEDLAETCLDCFTLDPTMNCGWCPGKNSCVKRQRCASGEDEWLGLGKNCTNPQILSFSPTSGPKEGGTTLSIRLANYKLPDQDKLYLAVAVAGIICRIPSRNPFPQLGILNCEIRRIPSILWEVKSGPVVIRGPEFRIESRLNFSFVDWKLDQISPTNGPMRGGTKMRIFGENLHTGAEALAFVGHIPCDITRRTNDTISCTTRSFTEQETFPVAVKIDGNDQALPPVFSYVHNPIIEQTNHKVLHGSIHGGNSILAEGYHLDGVQEAFFVVTINDTEYKGPCNVTTPETLHCISPKIEEDPEVLFPGHSSAEGSDYYDGDVDTNVLIVPFKFQLDTVDTFISNVTEDEHQFLLRLGGSAHAHQHEDESGPGIWLPILLSLLIFLLLTILAFLLFRRYRRRRDARNNKHSILTETELQDFEKGKPKEVERGSLAQENPYIVPYNHKFEIPEKRFTVDKESLLGVGTFGRVMKGSVDASPVAVKTLKVDAEKMHLTALMSELKILVHLGNSGKHPNIVNLVGAYTKQLSKGNLLVFVEYCPLGNLNQFLRTHRGHFVNQLEHDLIDLSTSSELYENVDPKDMLCTLDLVNYSHQMAKGMEYLEEKKIIHADLATRNVLLYDKTTIKITDFGLARKLYDYTNYVKKHQEPLPWRWMALESLRDLSFSHKSDVWSYGVTLWEIFALGDLPYPGLSWNIEFTDRLQHGLHNLKPKFSTSDIYNTMLECWRLQPEDRPSFADIRKFFAALLNDLSSQVEKIDDKDAEGYLMPLLPQSRSK